MTDPGITTELRLPSRLGFEKVAMNTAATVAQIMGFPDERIEDIKTAVSEACINAIEHGNRLDESQTVLVIMSMDDNTLEVRVVDQGEGVKRVAVSAPDMERKIHGEEDPRGMGMFLIRSLVDEAEWVAGSPHGSYARLAIHLTPDKNHVGGKN